MKKSLNLKGFSYYELLIAIAIMGIMTAFFTITVSTVHRNDTNRAAESIETCLRQARNSAISKGTKYGWANFVYSNGALYCCVGEEFKSPGAGVDVDFSSRNWEKISNNIDAFEIEFTNYGEKPEILHFTNSGEPIITFCFQQSTGECIGMKNARNGDYFYNSESSNYDITIKRRNNVSKVNLEKFGNISIQ